MRTPAFATQAPLPASRHASEVSTRACRRRVRCALARLPSRPTTSGALIEAFWERMGTRSYSSATALFSPDATYVDTLYPAPFEGREAIASHLRNMETAMPPSVIFVLDDLAPAADRVGARWHGETMDGTRVPFSRGASMYAVGPAADEDGGMWITEAWDFVETPFKVAGIVLPVLRAASAVLRRFDGR